ncbi:PD-(D/E)XK nuclease family protein [Nonomuraea sp. NPDC003709]|uniref:PD-(D/E)XK nuclease family protein n=1 Tax=Nonomuraea sp. NPDC003709 TaxID=3154450 RepID=UPI0033A06126
MAWIPPVELVGDSSNLRVSATILSGGSACGRYLALKARPKVNAAGWKPFYGTTSLFLPGDLVRLIKAAHAAPPEALAPSSITGWLQQQFDALAVHRLARPFLARAVENILEAHEAIEGELGPLRLTAHDPKVGRPGQQLSVWGPVYFGEQGVREVRRYRLGRAHSAPTEGDRRWGVTAAYVIARLGSRPDRVRAVEIGALDGSISVLFDDTPEAAQEAFQSLGMPHLLQVIEQTQASPGWDCAGCKIAGACDSLVPLTGMLGQRGPGIAFRSIAPYELQEYRQCPARWLLSRDLKLPKDQDVTEPQARGRAVHQWLRAAHERRVACRREDLPEPGRDLGLDDAAGLSPEEYAAAYPYLLQHLDKCPLGIPNTVVVGVEQPVHGVDHDAQVVVAAAPDLTVLRDGKLILREVKTAAALPPHGREEAYSQYLQIPFLVRMLASGLAAHHGVAAGRVELEMLTPDGAEVWAWNSDHQMTADVAAGDVRRAVEPWHTDATWASRPGPHCARCPVRQWCPDADDEHPPGTSPRQGIDLESLAGKAIHELPPF